jgi:pimeloyl-ACP methyl ester carboxylesterase
VVSEVTCRDLELSDGGDRLEAVWSGPAPDAAPTLVFLHEGLGCVALWRDIPARLVEMTGCGALVYSRLGYGASAPCTLPRPVDFMHHEGRVVLPEVIRQCGIRDHLLIGHSDGGSIALINAGGEPAPGLAGVVTLAAHVFCEAITRRSIQAARRRYLDGDLKARLAVYHGENTDCAFWGWNDVWLHPDFMRWNIEEFLPTIQVPVLAIQGRDDPYGTMAQVDAIQGKAGGPVTVQRVPGCGHAPHLEQSDVVVPGIRDFIQRMQRAVTHRR